MEIETIKPFDQGSVTDVVQRPNYFFRDLIPT